MAQIFTRPGRYTTILWTLSLSASTPRLWTTWIGEYPRTPSTVAMLTRQIPCPPAATRQWNRLHSRPGTIKAVQHGASGKGTPKRLQVHHSGFHVPSRHPHHLFQQRLGGAAEYFGRHSRRFCQAIDCPWCHYCRQDQVLAVQFRAHMDGYRRPQEPAGRRTPGSRRRCHRRCELPRRPRVAERNDWTRLYVALLVQISHVAKYLIAIGQLLDPAAAQGLFALRTTSGVLPLDGSQISST